jgi:hypothetical protein
LKCGSNHRTYCAAFAKGLLREKSGTGALPSVLLEAAGVRRLVSGGYIDAPTLVDSLHAFL